MTFKRSDERPSSIHRKECPFVITPIEKDEIERMRRLPDLCQHEANLQMLADIPRISIHFTPRCQVPGESTTNFFNNSKKYIPIRHGILPIKHVEQEEDVLLEIRADLTNAAWTSTFWR